MVAYRTKRANPIVLLCGDKMVAILFTDIAYAGAPHGNVTRLQETDVCIWMYPKPQEALDILWKMRNA